MALPRPFRIAVLISGGGTTLRNFIEKIEAGRLPVEIALAAFNQNTDLDITVVGDEPSGRHAVRALLVTGAKVIVYEQAVRFLGDHLDGDRYYRTTRPGHNLDRARNQVRLLESLETTIGPAR